MGSDGTKRRKRTGIEPAETTDRQPPSVLKTGSEWRASRNDAARKVTKSVEEGEFSADALGSMDEAHPAENSSPEVPTVADWFELWIAERIRRGLKSPESYRSIYAQHIGPVLGAQRLDVVRPAHIRALVDQVDRANRTKRNVYYLLRGVFGAAVAVEHLEVSPCRLPRGELPPNKDAATFDRANAVFAADEVHALTSHAAVEVEDRLFYAVHAAAILRPGEIWALTWADWRRGRRPLGFLHVTKSWRSQVGRLHTTKNDQQREVPIIPWLGRRLERWWDEGWCRAFGRAPKMTDLILPRISGAGEIVYGDNRRQAERWARHLRDLKLRRRRIYDLRATGITLAQEAGALPQVLEHITHATSGVSTSHNGGRVLRGYSRFSWGARCVAMLALERALGGAAQLSLTFEGDEE